MIQTLLFIFTLFSTVAVAKDYSELVEEYVKMNAEKIEVIANQKKNIKGVEIIVADKADSLASRFGHGLLRLIDDDPYWVNDVVISFSALSYEESYSMRKSIVGSYSITPQVMNLHEYWGLYTKKEERDLKRYVINLNPKQLNDFLDTLFTHIRNPELLDKYTFLSNNCIGVITKLFVEAGVTKKKSIAKVPTAVGSWVEENELSLYPEFIMKNFNSIHARLETFNNLSNQTVLKEFSTTELSYIYLNYPELSEEKSDFIASVIKGKMKNIDEAFSFNPIHSSLYTKCSSEACLNNFAENENDKLESSDKLDTIVHRLEQKSTFAKTYLKYLDFKRTDLVRTENDTRITSYKISVNKNKVFVNMNLVSRFETRTTSLREALPFTVDGDAVFLKNKKIGRVTEDKKLELEENFRLALIQDDQASIALISL